MRNGFVRAVIPRAVVVAVVSISAAARCWPDRERAVSESAPHGGWPARPAGILGWRTRQRLA